MLCDTLGSLLIESGPGILLTTLTTSGSNLDVPRHSMTCLDNIPALRTTIQVPPVEYGMRNHPARTAGTRPARLCTCARRAIAIACTTATHNIPHTIVRSLRRTQRMRRVHRQTPHMTRTHPPTRPHTKTPTRLHSRTNTARRARSTSTARRPRAADGLRGCADPAPCDLPQEQCE